MKCAMSPHPSWDWCHLCGRRSHGNVDVWYPGNAESDLAVGPGPPHHGRQYIRICADCGYAIGHMGRGERIPEEGGHAN